MNLLNCKKFKGGWITAYYALFNIICLNQRELYFAKFVGGSKEILLHLIDMEEIDMKK